MPKFAANLSMLFTEVPFLERFEQASAAGFLGVEYVTPYDQEPHHLAEILHRQNLKQVLFNLPAGDWAASERGIACLPDRVGEFQDGVGQAIAYAKVLGNQNINCLAGIKPDSLSRERAHQTLAANLHFAAKALEAEGLVLLLEPINSYDMPGFFVNTSNAAMAYVLATPNLKLQYDIYHMQRMEGELASTITRLLPHIGHFQVAGNPGRTEPDRGEINCAWLFNFIDQLGYGGWIGAEYKPSGGTTAGLGWLRNDA